MPTRDDFTGATKRQLAERAGYKCSFLGCGKPTIGPSDEKDKASSSIGTAAHIAAAAPGKGARRYISAMTSDERKHINNGIWMCEDHGKLVDTDEERFSIEILEKWKMIAEAVARLMVERNCTYEEALNTFHFTDLTINQITFDGIGSENQIVGDAMHDCCVSLSWGNDLATVARDFIIEHIRNAFQHGKATEISFEANKNRLVITDNGNVFNPKNLLGKNTKTGGRISTSELFKKFGSKLILSTQRKDNMNITTIAVLKNQDDILEITPCSYKINSHEFRRGSITLTISETCNEIFIVLPTYISPSDIGMMQRKLVDLENEGRPVTFITRQLSELVISMIKEHHPSCQILEIY